MRALVFIVVILAALYGAYWFVGASQVEARAEAALVQLEAQGWQADYAALDTRGFPSRFDTTVTDLSLVSPDGAVAWEAPFLQIFALSYRPNRVIAAWPTEQRLALGGQTLDISSEGLRASAALGLSADLPLTDARLESGPLSIASEAGWRLGLDRLLAAIRPAGPAPGAYDVFLEAEGLRPPAVDAALRLLRLDGQVTLDAPLDRSLQGAPRLLGFALRELRIAQGGAALSASGDLAPDAQGFLAGTLTLRAENWRDILALLESAGLLVHDQAPFLAGALEELAGGGDDIELPVTFRDGQVEALGVVLLPAPRVR